MKLSFWIIKATYCMLYVQGFLAYFKLNNAM